MLVKATWTHSPGPLRVGVYCRGDGEPLEDCRWGEGQERDQWCLQEGQWTRVN